MFYILGHHYLMLQFVMNQFSELYTGLVLQWVKLTDTDTTQTAGQLSFNDYINEQRPKPASISKDITREKGLLMMLPIAGCPN